MVGSHARITGALLLAAGILGWSAAAAPAQNTVLKIGTSGSLAEGTSGSDENAAMNTLHNFIQTETGFNNEIVRQKGWQDLANHMDKGDLSIGVFEGYELAWAKEKHPKLKPLAVAVNVQPYRQIFIVKRKNEKARSIDEMQGKKVSIPKAGQGYPLLVLETLVKKEPKQFFGNIKFSDNVEDSLDDLVDGVVDIAAVDRQALDSYKRRKPGRFNQLGELAKSKPLPPPVIVYEEGRLDDATLRKFRDGLLNANQKEKGRSLLTFFKLTGFSTPPSDFQQVLNDTRKNYPPSQHDAAE